MKKNIIITDLTNLITTASERTKTGRPTAAAKRAVQSILSSGITPNSPEFFALSRTEEQKVLKILGAALSTTHVKVDKKSGL